MDYVDLYLIHWPDESRPMEEPMAAFKQFQQEGKIRYGGVSNFSVAQMEECFKHFPIVCNQIGYNLFDRRPEPEVLPFCLKRGVGVMAYGSLAFGLLTGAMTPDTTFGGDDWRRSGMAFGLPLFKEENFQKNLQIVERLKEIAKKKRKAVAQLAVAWVLSNPAVSVALTGIRKPEEIEENVGAAAWRLTASEKQEIEAAFKVG
jgi:aryl-alcohol dehydrogenase-like predicted oxidoreductase